MPRPTAFRPLLLSGIALAVAGAAACDVQAPIIASNETFALGLKSAYARAWKPTATEPVTLEMTMAPTVKRGGRLPIRVRLHNGSTRPIAIGFGQRHGFDLIVAMPDVRADSGAVWSPYKGGDVGSVANDNDVTITDPLRPGADTTFEVVWPVQDDDGRDVPAGRYRVRATVAAELLSTRQIWTSWVPVEVLP
ncbi:MAG: hypothetical protein JO180_00070 [Gemmatirosa sp.]|nr:hypothetical protein [Gemmatirosa sp.]